MLGSLPQFPERTHKNTLLDDVAIVQIPGMLFGSET